MRQCNELTPSRGLKYIERFWNIQDNCYYLENLTLKSTNS